MDEHNNTRIVKVFKDGEFTSYTQSIFDNHNVLAVIEQVNAFTRKTISEGAFDKYSTYISQVIRLFQGTLKI